MIKTVTVFVLAAAILVSVQLVDAQQAGKVYRVGIVTLGFFTAAQKEILRQRLRDLGSIEGQNIFYEWRFAEGKLDRLPNLVAELIRLKVDVIVSNSTEAIKMVVNMNRAMRVVMASISDPLGSGLIASLARPGGSVTGLSMLSTELGGKRLELLRKPLPGSAV